MAKYSNATALVPTMSVDKASLKKVTANIRKLMGATTRIEGTLTEHMNYAVYQEFGTARSAPRPHMRPAYVWVLGRVLPKVAAAVGEWLRGHGLTKYAPVDAKLHAVMTGLLYEMEAARVRSLRRVIYTSSRIARERDESYTGYRLTGNLLNARSIVVKMFGGLSRTTKPRLPKLSKAGA